LVVAVLKQQHQQQPCAARVQGFIRPRGLEIGPAQGVRQRPQARVARGMVQRLSSCLILILHGLHANWLGIRRSASHFRSRTSR
jgi:hypothetical protein